jgi:hypothetical protein
MHTEHANTAATREIKDLAARLIDHLGAFQEDPTKPENSEAYSDLYTEFNRLQTKHHCFIDGGALAKEFERKNPELHKAVSAIASIFRDVSPKNCNDPLLTLVKYFGLDRQQHGAQAEVTQDPSKKPEAPTFHTIAVFPEGHFLDHCMNSEKMLLRAHDKGKELSRIEMNYIIKFRDEVNKWRESWSKSLKSRIDLIDCILEAPPSRNRVLELRQRVALEQMKFTSENNSEGIKSKRSR